MNNPPLPSLGQRLQGLNIYLIGMMGAGKSAVGRPLAEALSYRFIDADDAIEQVAGSSIPEIFTTEGEAGFREMETAVLSQIAGWHSLVVATGGGVVTRPENWGHMRQGVVVWLDAPAPLLLKRLRADSTPRPLLQVGDPAARLSELMAQRQPLYAQADLRVPQAGDSPAQVVQQVLEGLPAILKDPATAPEAPIELRQADGQIRSSLN
ncbi:MAG: shikimate kinase [Cyanobacteria bacterium]|nr:shikimate kinase [Cyanobacteriota bacterium]MDA1246569.1 shikimate kinase [Cyanobacteriota bacterium]